jgi:RNA polymerase sigma factor (sigma-70 family)
MTDTQGIAEIIEQARCGDLEARCALVKIHHLALRSYLAAICGNPSVTDDLAQEVFLRALDRLDRVIDPAKFPLFLRGIARNVVREHARSQSRFAKHAEAYGLWVEDLLEDQPEPLYSQNTQVVGALRKCLRNLPERSRHLLQERYFEEQEAGEIGKKRELSAAAVRNALLRARRALLKCMEKSLPELPKVPDA